MLDCGLSQQGVAYLVMELLNGGTLAERLLGGQRVRVARAAQLGEPVCRALAAAHDAGLVHRDVKPENMLIHMAPGGGEIVKVLDFGIAKLMSSLEEGDSERLTHGIVGTPPYFTPERISGEAYDGKADVLSSPSSPPEWSGS